MDRTGPGTIGIIVMCTHDSTVLEGLLWHGLMAHHPCHPPWCSTCGQAAPTATAAKRAAGGCHPPEACITQYAMTVSSWPCRCCGTQLHTCCCSRASAAGKHGSLVHAPSPGQHLPQPPRNRLFLVCISVLLPSSYWFIVVCSILCPPPPCRIPSSHPAGHPFAPLHQLFF